MTNMQRLLAGGSVWGLVLTLAGMGVLPTWKFLMFSALCIAGIVVGLGGVGDWDFASLGKRLIHYTLWMTPLLAFWAILAFGHPSIWVALALALTLVLYWNCLEQ